MSGLRDTVAAAYRNVASFQAASTVRASAHALNVGYTPDELQRAPDLVQLGLSCGNPISQADLQTGEVVLDLGSGAGFDVLLAAAQVGHCGKVYGVDFVPEMVARVRLTAMSSGCSNVEFRLGDIEDLPIDSNSIDCVISNCTFNLLIGKERALREILRVLKPGGRIALLETVLLNPLPEDVAASQELYTCCVSGALQKAEYLRLLRQAGFSDADISLGQDLTSVFVDERNWRSESSLGISVVAPDNDVVAGALIRARKSAAAAAPVSPEPPLLAVLGVPNNLGAKLEGCGVDVVFLNAGDRPPTRRGKMTTRTSIPYFCANSKSRSSCAGTDMMAPVP